MWISQQTSPWTIDISVANQNGTCLPPLANAIYRLLVSVWAPFLSSCFTCGGLFRKKKEGRKKESRKASTNLRNTVSKSVRRIIDVTMEGTMTNFSCLIIAVDNDSRYILSLNGALGRKKKKNAEDKRNPRQLLLGRCCTVAMLSRKELFRWPLAIQAANIARSREASCCLDARLTGRRPSKQTHRNSLGAVS